MNILEIVPQRLYVASHEIKQLEIKKRRIATIINLTFQKKENDNFKELNVKNYCFDDSKEEILTTYFEEINDLIDSSKANVMIYTDKKNLISTFTIAYIMKKKRWNFEKTCSYVQKKECIVPSQEFVQQLKNFEEHLLRKEMDKKRIQAIGKTLRVKILKEEGIETCPYSDFSEIIKENLFLSGKFFNRDKLNEKNIKTIINVAHFKNFNDDSKYSDQCEVHSFKFNDVASQKLDFLKICDLIEKSKKPVLVKCVHGKSRSAAFVIAYLIQNKKIGFEDAFRFVLKKRSCVLPNHGFISQLMEFEG